MEPRPGVPRPAFYTVQEAAEILRMSVSHIREGIRSGEIPGRKVGTAYRVSARYFDDDPPARPERSLARLKSDPTWS